MFERYTCLRSSAAYRVRIALGLKKLDFRAVPVQLLRDGGEQNAAVHRALNLQGLVPTPTDGEHRLTQSPAIMEYRDEAYAPALLLPSDAAGRARVRPLALQVACDIHPLNNLRVLRCLKHELAQTDAAHDAWCRPWVELGFQALEQCLASPRTGRFRDGDSPSLADCCLVPQVFDARRFDTDVSRLPAVERIERTCAELEAFRLAAPEMQAGAPLPTASWRRGQGRRWTFGFEPQEV